MLKIDTYLIYQHIIKVISELITTDNIENLCSTFAISLKHIISEYNQALFIWDKYEEGKECFAGNMSTESYMLNNFKKIVEHKDLSSSGRFAKSPLLTEPAVKGNRYFFTEKRELEDGVTGIFFIEFKNEDSFHLFNFISGDVIPQFWTLLIERYNHKKAGEESNLLWELKDAHSEEDFLNSIELNHLLENLLKLALRKTNTKIGVTAQHFHKR